MSQGVSASLAGDIISHGQSYNTTMFDLGYGMTAVYILIGVFALVIALAVISKKTFVNYERTGGLD